MRNSSPGRSRFLLALKFWKVEEDDKKKALKVENEVKAPVVEEEDDNVPKSSEPEYSDIFPGTILGMIWNFP